MTALFAMDQDQLTTVGDAVAAVGRLGQAIVAAGQTVSVAALGPWQISVTCGYDWFLFGNLHTCTYSARVDFSGSRANFQQVLHDAENESQAFFQQFQPMEAWFSGTVPATSTKFDAAGTLINQVVTAQQSGTPPTDEQCAAVLGALNGLVTILEASRDTLMTQTGVVGQYLQGQDGYRRLIDQTKDGLVADVQNALSAMQTFTNQQPCGQVDANSQFAAIHGQFNATVAAFDQAFSTLDDAANTASQGVSLIMGTIVNFITSYQTALDQLGAAEGAQFARALQELHFDVSWDAWMELAKYAAAQESTVSQTFKGLRVSY